jgi:hypothetical protein
VGRTILKVLGVAALMWLAWDLFNAIQFGQTQDEGSAVVSMYEARHGSLSTFEERQRIYSNAQQACAYLDRNPSLPQLWRAMTDSGISGDAAATTIEAGITHVCPQFTNLLEEEQ